MVSLRLPPTFMPGTPSSRPLISSPAPSAKSSGSRRARLESNCFPSASRPTEGITTSWPASAVAPRPSTRSSFKRAWLRSSRFMVGFLVRALRFARAKKRSIPDFRDFDDGCEGRADLSRGELLKPRMLQSSEASTLRPNALDGERYRQNAPTGSHPEPPPPPNCISIGGDARAQHLHGTRPHPHAAARHPGRRDRGLARLRPRFPGGRRLRARVLRQGGPRASFSRQ